ncbi:MAG: hypothetical protein ACYDBB_06990 [Armatimonadota bacterium]
MTHLTADRNDALLHSDAQLICRQQRELTLLLQALAKLSAEQMSSHTVTEWNVLLDKKQLLLDEIVVRQPEQLLERTCHFADQLLAAGDIASSQELQTTRELNKRLFSEIAQLEQAAQQQMQSQIETLRASLTDLHQRHNMCRMYQEPAHAQSSRFLNGMR